MGFRFSKRIRLMPGVRLNVGLRGLSVSAGPRGASVTVGPRGVHGNVGLPGTGLSYRTRLDAPPSRKVAGRREVAAVSGPVSDTRSRAPERIQLSFVGAELKYRDEHGMPLDGAVIQMAKSAFRDQIRSALDGRAADLNAPIDLLQGFYCATPAPSPPGPFPMSNGSPFAVPKPQPSVDPNDPRDYPTRLSDWRIAQAAHTGEPNEVDLEAIAEPVLARLGAITWPRETNISVDLDPTGQILLLAVDLPEPEDMPREEYAVVARSLTLKQTALSGRALNRLYVSHVHGLLFRVIGEAMAAHGAFSQVRVGAYCQRTAPSTARREDVWIAEIAVDRSRWAEIDFRNLVDLDPEQALKRFEPRILVTAAGVFRPIKVSRDFSL